VRFRYCPVFYRQIIGFLEHAAGDGWAGQRQVQKMRVSPVREGKIMERSDQQVVSDLRMLLRDMPPYTTANVTECAVIYLEDGHLRGVYLRADEQDGLDQPFAVNSWFIGQAHEDLMDWFSTPRFSHRPALRAWALDAPPAAMLDPD
jgi:hypothetical protein